MIYDEWKPVLNTEPSSKTEVPKRRKVLYKSIWDTDQSFNTIVDMECGRLRKNHGNADKKWISKNKVEIYY